MGAEKERLRLERLRLERIRRKEQKIRNDWTKARAQVLKFKEKIAEQNSVAATEKGTYNETKTIANTARKDKNKKMKDAYKLFQTWFQTKNAPSDKISQLKT